jgi:hypothetical protein
VGAVRTTLERDPGALHSINLTPFGEQRSDLGGESSGATPKMSGSASTWRLSARSSMKRPAAPLDLPRREIAFASAHADEAETIEVDVGFTDRAASL